MKKFVFWDYDGTLSYFDLGYFSDTLLHVMDGYRPGHGFSRETFAGPMRSEYFWHSYDTPHPELNGRPDAWWAHVCAIFARQFRAVGVPEDKARELAQKAREIYTDPARHLLYEDTLPALRLLHERGVRQAVLSNHVPELDAIVAASPVAPYTEFVINSADIGFEKPRAEIFTAALERAGYAADECVMVGDNANADIAGACTVGIAGVLIRKPRDGREAAWAQDALAAARLIADGHV